MVNLHLHALVEDDTGIVVNMVQFDMDVWPAETPGVTYLDVQNVADCNGTVHIGLVLDKDTKKTEEQNLVFTPAPIKLQESSFTEIQKLIRILQDKGLVTVEDVTSFLT